MATEAAWLKGKESKKKTVLTRTGLLMEGPNPFKWQIADSQSTDLKSAAAGKNR